jgi:hypothetical protein
LNEKKNSIYSIVVPSPFDCKFVSLDGIEEVESKDKEIELGNKV